MGKLKFLSLVMLFIASSIALSSCSNDDEPAHETQKTIYIIKSDLGADKMAIEYGAKSYLTLLCMEYNDQSELINTQTWNNVRDGDNKWFDANERCVKVVIRIELKVEANGKTVEKIMYVATVNYLNLKDKTFILLDGNTRTSSYNPI